MPQAAQPQPSPVDDGDALAFDLEAAEKQLPEEKRKAFAFETTMEAFKTIVTTKTKMLPYELADELGVADYIEEFYEFLNQKDKDGIIQLKKDEVIINKTKVMGALMLGDNSLLDRIMTTFRAWLMKVMK